MLGAARKVGLGGTLFETRVITEGTDNYLSFDYYGFNVPNYLIGPFGSIDNNQYRGETIVKAYFVEGGGVDNFLFSVDGDQTGGGQEFLFESILPQDDVTLTSASANSFQYIAATDSTNWSWTSVTRPSSWDGIGTRTIILKAPQP